MPSAMARLSTSRFVLESRAGWYLRRSIRCAGSFNTQNPIVQHNDAMTIQRLYEPDPEALDRVVEILCRLLVEPLGGREETHDSGGEPTKAPCFSTKHQG